MQKLLTIGMSTYDDYDGVFFSIQALRMYQLQNIEKDIEIIVIDNNPDSKHGEAVKSFVNNWAKQKYIPYTEKQSTTSRNEIFKHAAGKYTLCMDSHVLFEPGAINNLLHYYHKNPDTQNLIQGPLWYDDLTNVATHFDPIWRDRMHGIWAKNKEAFEKNEPFEIPMMGLGVFSCKTSAWLGFNEAFKGFGEIPMMGLGVFSCKTSAWLGFNEAFKGFGGEEGYIHEKFRRAGGKCICLPNFKWNHRFGRPNGVPYPNKLEDRIRNYFIGWLEILKDPNDPFFQSIIDGFKQYVKEDIILNIFDKVKNEQKSIN